MNKGKKIKVQKIPYCSCIDLHAELQKVKLLIYGGFETSSDLEEPLQIGGQVNGGHYDCYNHNFKRKEK
tara:strand:+ start:295 stop:501 length:207 start_codon:yes stop_codon:yes gene_type:complete